MAIVALTNPYALKNATLSIDADDYTAAVTQVEFSPSTATSTVRTIDGVAHKDQSTAEWNCTIGFVQDLAPGGLLRYLLDNDGESKAVVFTPKTAGPSIAATLVVSPGSIGGTAGADLTTASVTLVSTKPVFTDTAAAVPVITGALPSGAAVGDQVVLSGYNFTGTTDVDFDAVAADFVVVDSHTLVAIVPATITGATDITVTNAAGVSAAHAYTAA